LKEIKKGINLPKARKLKKSKEVSFILRKLDLIEKAKAKEEEK